MVDFSTELTPTLFGQQLNELLDLSVKDFGAVGDGAADDTGPIQAAINSAAGTGAALHFPSGVYKHTGLTFKNKAQYRGAGRDTAATLGTVLLYTGIGDGVQVNNPINSSTAANISVEGITFKNVNRNAGKGCFADTGSTDIKFRQCAFIGSDRGLILDQSELVDVTECDFEAVTSQAALIWITNGADRTLGALAGFSNRISISKCQLNGTTGTVLIADDGGGVHSFNDNNYNAGATQIRAAGVGGMIVNGGEFESATAAIVRLEVTTLAGANGPGSCDAVSFISPVMVPVFGQTCVAITAVAELGFFMPYFGNSSAAKVTGCVNANGIFSLGAHDAGGGATFDGLATNHFQVDHSGAIITNLPLKISGNQVVGARRTGWTAATGTPARGAFVAAAAGAASVGYVQAEAQGALDRVAALEARFIAWEADARVHGLIDG